MGDDSEGKLGRRDFNKSVAGTLVGAGLTSGISEVEAQSEGEEIWSFETGGEVVSSPTVVDGTVYVGSSDGNLYSIDAGTGDEVWSFETDGTVSSPIVVDGTLYVGSDALYALDIESGEEVWRFETKLARVSRRL